MELITSGHTDFTKKNHLIQLGVSTYSSPLQTPWKIAFAHLLTGSDTIKSEPCYYKEKKYKHKTRN